MTTKAIVQVSGVGWRGDSIALQKELLPYQVENMRDNSGGIPQRNFERWLRLNTVTLAHITSWNAEIKDGKKAVKFRSLKEV